MSGSQHTEDNRGTTETSAPTSEALLDFEAARPGYTRNKDEVIRRRFGITPVRYYVLLNRAASSLAGMAHDPITARRIRERSARAGR